MQQELDQIEQRLGLLRESLMKDRVKARVELDNLIRDSADLRQRAEGGAFEPAIVSVYDLLITIKSGITAQDHLASCQHPQVCDGSCFLSPNNVTCTGHPVPVQKDP